MKTKNIKKIISISIIALVLTLMVTTIVLAIVPKKQYDPVNRDFNLVTIYREKINNTYFDKDKPEHVTVIEDVIKLHEKSLKDNVLSSIFQGTGKFNSRVEKYNYSNLIGNIAKVDGTLCVVFTYNIEQTLMMDGKEYKDETTHSSKVVKYDKLFMPVANKESFEECTIYLANSDNQSSYQIKFLAHQSELYDYIRTLNWPHAVV